jgi:hypothetical protein
MRWENPFFTLELRRRRSRFRLYRIARASAVVVGIPTVVATVASLLGWQLWWMPFLWTAVTAALLVGAAGVGLVGGSQVFGVERMEGTLDNLRLLPLFVSQWLVGKLQYPMLLLLTVPMAAAPGLLVAAIQGIIPISQVLPTLAYLLAMGYFWLLTGAWYHDPAPVRKEREITLAGLGAAIHETGKIGLYMPHILLGMVGPLLALVPSQFDRFGNTAFFTAHVSPWWVIGAALAAGSVVAIANARKALAETPKSLRTASIALWFGYAVDVFLIAGLIGKQSWGAVLLGSVLAWPLMMLIPARSTPQQQQPNRRLEEELAWLEARFPNPVFLANVRFHLGRSSLRKRAFGSLLALLPITVLLAAVFVAGRYAGLGPLVLILEVCAPLLLVPWLCIPPARTVGWWSREQDAAQLTLTPLTSREWVVGQVAANFLANLCRYWNVLLVTGLCLLWLTTTPQWSLAAPGLFGMVTIVTLGLAIHGLPPTQLPSPEIRQSLRRNEIRLIAKGLGLLCLATAALTLGALGDNMPWLGFLAGLLSLAGLFLPLPALRELLNHGSEGLEHLRRGEMVWNAPATAGK